MTQHFYQPYITQALPVFDATSSLYYRGNSGAAAMDTQHQFALQQGYHSHHQQMVQHLRDLHQTALYHQRSSDAMLRSNAQQTLNMSPSFAGMDSPTSVTQIKRTQTKAERRAEHNAIERLRRENLNNQFQQLANTLPNLENDRRPSKGTIIERTLDFVKDTAVREEQMKIEIENLRAEQDNLRRQLEQDFSPSLDSDDSSDGSFSPIESNHCPSSTIDSCPTFELPSSALEFYPETQLDSLFATSDYSAMYNALEGPENAFGIPCENDDDNSTNANPDKMNFTSAPLPVSGSNTYPSATQSIFGFPLYQQ